jgi:hypothetical protein
LTGFLFTVHWVFDAEDRQEITTTREKMNSCMDAMIFGLDRYCAAKPEPARRSCMVKIATKFQVCLAAEEQERAKIEYTLKNIRNLNAQLEELTADAK